MGQLTSKFEHSPGDVVQLLPLEVEAKVLACKVSLGGIDEYEVAYWIEGERRITWVYAEEIEKTP